MRTEMEFRSHFWTPDDPRYLHYGWPFDQTKCALILLPAGDQGYVPAFGREQLNAAARAVVEILLALEKFAAITSADARHAHYHKIEEDRHIRTLVHYHGVRWPHARDFSVSNVSAVLTEIHTERTAAQARTFAGEIVEPLALALCACLHARSADPLLVRLCSFIIADEVMHGPDNTSAPAPDPDSLHRLGTDAARLFDATILDVANATGGGSDIWCHVLTEYASDIGGRLRSIGVPRETFSASALGMCRISADADASIKEIARTATAFLESVRTDSRPTVSAALAVEWLAAGLRSAAPLFEESRKS